MKTSYTQNNFFAYLLILASLFVLLFFTKDIFAQMQIALDEQEQQKIIREEKKQTLSQLTALSDKLSQDGSDALAEIQWFTGEFSSEDILEYLHKYAWQVNSGNERIIMKDISINADQISDLGFKRASVDISATFSRESTLFWFLNFLTNSGGKYKFYISQFTYPMNDSPWNIQVNIPLTLYYK